MPALAAWAYASAILVAQAPVIDPHVVQPERPTVATHAGTVARGWLEIETGIELDRFAAGLYGGSMPTAFKIGLASRAQLTVATPIVRDANTHATRFGDVSAGVKWRFAEDAPVLGRFAVMPSIKAPTGSVASGTGTGTTDLSLLFISSRDFGSVAVDVNAGYTHRSGDGSNAPKNATIWTVSAGGPARGWLGWTAELFGFPGTAGGAGAPAIVGVLAGPTMTARDWLVFDVGVIARVSGPQPRAFYMGLVYNVGKLGR